MSEQEAYVEMVDWLSGFMTYFPASGFSLADYPDRVGLEVFHGFQSNMEEMAFLLDEVGILEGIPVDPAVMQESDRFMENIRLRRMPPTRRFFARCRIFLRDLLRSLGLIAPAPVRQASPNQFRFVVPPDQVRELARKAYAVGSPSFEEVLNCFIYNATCYDSLPDARTSFVAPSEFIPAIEQLSTLGYATREGGRFLWADAIAPAMLRIYAWTEAGQSQTEFHNAEVARLIREMPERMRGRLTAFFQRGQKLNAVACLTQECGWRLSEAKEAVDILHADWLKENSPT